VGSVRWLEPVDVRGLDLGAAVQLAKGSIEVGVAWVCVGGCVEAGVRGLQRVAQWAGGLAGWLAFLLVGG
jgi:hypothetical protein